MKRLLIANRGEIAVRVVRTAREMGLETVAVYAVADAASRHVREADRALPLGDGPPAQTYLSIERLIEAARASGAASSPSRSIRVTRTGSPSTTRMTTSTCPSPTATTSGSRARAS